MMRKIFKEMVIVTEELMQDPNGTHNYNLMENKRIRRLSNMFEDKKILQHFFDRVWLLYQDDDA